MRVLLLLAFCALLAACSSELRGSQAPSPDGGTYLVFEELDGPACETVYVNGKVWPHKVGIAGRVEPGKTIAKCWGEIGFIVKPGHTFRVNYWGP
jgi:hypothetical protein